MKISQSLLASEAESLAISSRSARQQGVWVGTEQSAPLNNWTTELTEMSDGQRMAYGNVGRENAQWHNVRF